MRTTLSAAKRSCVHCQQRNSKFHLLISSSVTIAGNNHEMESRYVTWLLFSRIRSLFQLIRSVLSAHSHRLPPFSKRKKEFLLTLFQESSAARAAVSGQIVFICGCSYHVSCFPKKSVSGNQGAYHPIRVICIII